MTKQAALNFFADLLPAQPKTETLFETPVAKPKRMARRWKVTAVAVITQLCSCEACGTHYQITNPHMLLTKSLNDYDGRIIKTVQTDCPEEADLAMLSDETVVETSSVVVSTSTVCSACVAGKSAASLKVLFKDQVKRLQADPERRKAQAEKAAKAEQELMDLIDAYDQSPTVNADTSELDIILRDADLPY